VSKSIDATISGGAKQNLEEAGTFLEKKSAGISLPG